MQSLVRAFCVSIICRCGSQYIASGCAAQAEDFIYIENQYFLGGSGEWQRSDLDDICSNLIPIEIALKIAEKIRSKQRFAAYITIPLFPEGVPESGAVQEVLHWQSLSIRMMYRIVGQVRPHLARTSTPSNHIVMSPLFRTIPLPIS